MKPNNNRRAVTVGIFIVLGLLIFVAAVFTLGGQKKTFEKKIPVKAMFSDVGGLQVGNNVWFLGVKVGTIRKMNFAPNQQVEIIMQIETKAAKFIKKDSKAKVGAEGFIGNKIVVIYGGTASSPTIEEDDVLAADNGTSTDEMLATLQANNKNLLDITGNLKTVSKQMLSGDGIVGTLLNDATLSNDLQTALADFKRASSNAQQLTAEVSAYAGKLQAKGSLTNDLITDTVIFNKLKATVSQFQEASQKANEITDNMKLVSNNIQKVSNNLNDTKSPAGVLLNDKQAGDNLKVLLYNLQSGSKKLDENMEALQHNFLLRGFFKKKAKNEKNNPPDTLFIPMN
ncbi:MAG: MlaD family protein [Chitinophagaceae bacterium]